MMKMTQAIDSTHGNYASELKRIIFKQHAFMQRLVYLRQINAKAYLSAGVIRNLVWSSLHQHQYAIEQTEIDVIFYDARDWQTEQQRLTELLCQQFPDNEWDVVNQAFVHMWYKTENGDEITPYCSISDAMSKWPETATAIAVRLLEHDDLDIIAPFGLNDLFELKLRWNDRLVSHDVFIQRVQSKRFLERWKKLEMIKKF